MDGFFLKDFGGNCKSKCHFISSLTALSPQKVVYISCSSIYSQLFASLAICKRVKKLNPGIETILGGYIHGSRGTRILANYPSIDYISLGEGDESILETCRILIGEKKFPMPYGIMCRDDLGKNADIPYRLTRDMNKVPMPDYSDYMEEVKLYDSDFYQTAASDDKYIFSTRLFLEGSRGCWWGEKHPCSCCALNGLKNVFRSKDTDRIYHEIKTLTEKYPDIPIQL